MSIKRQVINQFRDICYDALVNKKDSWTYKYATSDGIYDELSMYYTYDNLKFTISTDNNVAMVIINESRVTQSKIIYLSSRLKLTIHPFDKFHGTIRKERKRLRKNVIIKKNQELINHLPVENQRKLKINKFL